MVNANVVSICFLSVTFFKCVLVSNQRNLEREHIFSFHFLVENQI